MEAFMAKLSDYSGKTRTEFCGLELEVDFDYSAAIPESRDDLTGGEPAVPSSIEVTAINLLVDSPSQGKVRVDLGELFEAYDEAWDDLEEQVLAQLEEDPPEEMTAEDQGGDEDEGDQG